MKYFERIVSGYCLLVKFYSTIPLKIISFPNEIKKILSFENSLNFPHTHTHSVYKDKKGKQN